ncbi:MULTISPECIES: malate:quinone oxidoreductase [Prochlorococcus]|uniref:malate:quinone oxidoreductase n=1 Tax=Prochlorococcus TaxID=1218 RepID=UPI0005337FE5|nr:MULTISPECIES: malate:quinone oxidoreductase [Prochlorococcus]KGG12976.1 Malate:quinone oxidoreductase [Prochlorococcus sp. MIT 0601]
MFISEALGDEDRFDAVLIGAGIMSSTLAVLLSELEPGIRILLVERLDAPALESSSAFNNSGTGHAANCEFNYTPVLPGGNIQIAKALNINAAFERSLEFWASLSERGQISKNNFLNVLPHISFVWKKDDVHFLKNRYLKLSATKAFQGMEWSNDKEELRDWMPIVMGSRQPNESVAATRVHRGTDIDFGALTRAYFDLLQGIGTVETRFSTEVQDIKRVGQEPWQIFLKSDAGDCRVETNFVFLGAGGGALTLLQKSQIPESTFYGGFPVSGQWLICNQSILAEKHNAKVYGKAEIGAPPMSVPHLDTRWIGGRRSLLFGPFAGFNTKFLKNGSNLDLFRSIQLGNVGPMLQAGWKNLDLIQYLIGQLQQTHTSRIELMRNFFPEANQNDWDLSIAGQRVQIIKKTSDGGILKMGTEVVTSSDGSLAALLGASPGASTAVSIMLEVLNTCWGEQMATDLWKERLCRLLPNLGEGLSSEENLLNSRERNNHLLGLGK